MTMNKVAYALVGLVLAVGGGSLAYSWKQDTQLPVKATISPITVNVTYSLDMSQLLRKGLVVHEGILENRIRDEMSRFAQRAHSLGDPATELTFGVRDATISYSLLTPDQRRTTDAEIPVMEDIIRFIQEKYEEAGVPSLSFVFAYPQTQDELKASEPFDSMKIPLKINLVDAISRVYDLEVKGKKVTFQDTVTDRRTYGTSGFSHLLTAPDANHIKITYSVQPIIAAQSTNRERRLLVPAEEIMHVHLYQFEMANGAAEFFRRGQEINATGHSPTMSELNGMHAEIMKSRVEASELMVHGSLRGLFKEYAEMHPELGIDPNNLGQRLNWHARQVEMAEAVINGIGLTRAVALYKENPLWILEATKK